MEYSDSTTTITSWEESDWQDKVDYSLASEVFEQHDYLFEKKREHPRRQKLLDDLVREHIEGNRLSKSKLLVLFDKFLYGR